MEKSFCRIIRRFDSHHNAFAGDLHDFDFAPIECFTGNIWDSWLLKAGWWYWAWLLRWGKKLLSNYQTLWFTSHRPRLLLISSVLQNDELEIYETQEKRIPITSCLKIQLGMRPTLPLSLCYFLHYSFDVFVLAQHKVKRRSVIILNDWWVHTINFWTIFGWWCLAWPLGCGKKLLSNYQTLWYTSHRPCSKLLKSWVQEP